jgi:hypothetical protein
LDNFLLSRFPVALAKVRLNFASTEQISGGYTCEPNEHRTDEGLELSLHPVQASLQPDDDRLQLSLWQKKPAAERISVWKLAEIARVRKEVIFSVSF